jgi:hypothetical protein
VLVCKTCDRYIQCTSEDLLAYTREGWPRCCGETMALFIETRLPTETAS